MPHHVVASSTSVRAKDVRYDPWPYGPGAVNESGIVTPFNFVWVDNWYPQTGVSYDGGHTFVVPVGGWYQLEAWCFQPETGVYGWGSGWSGGAHGWSLIRTNRYGDEGRQQWSWDGGGGGSTNDMHVGPFNRYLYAGDWVQHVSGGGAQGLGVQTYGPRLLMQKLRA